MSAPRGRLFARAEPLPLALMAGAAALLYLQFFNAFAVPYSGVRRSDRMEDLRKVVIGQWYHSCARGDSLEA